MKIEFDEKKNQLNINKHGFSLNAFQLLDFDLAIYEEDLRKSYSETHYNIFAPIEGRLCVATFTIRNNKYRIISLRKANKREVRFYEKKR